MERRKKIQGLEALVIVLLVVLLAVMVRTFFSENINSVAALQAYIEKFGVWGPLVLTAIQAIQVVLPVLPGFLGCAVGAVLFGPFAGFLCNYIGISAGSIIAFFLAKRFGQPLLRDLFPAGKYDKYSRWASKSRSYSAFLFMATLLPLFPDDYLCYLTGLSKMTARRFIMIIVLGKPWCILAYSWGFSLIQ